ncbi:DUF6702 family protein [Mucilaginibacter sp. UYCu711]|uniref:DUF6702 family protein n=1 Tax=Mucilaginibacter sp. UYCu711 TaxID=3156339 RepID=UPI003D1957D2
MSPNILNATHHPIHVATTELSFNGQDNKMEGTCTLFTDDFEAGLEKQFHTKIDLSKADMHQSMDVLVRNYIYANLQVKNSNTPVALNYLGFEIDHEAINVYLESNKTTQPATINVTVSLLYNLYDDQINIVHLSVRGIRKSTKVNYPDKFVSQSF